MYRIFLIEDDEVIAGAVVRYLEGWGYTVRCAERFDDVLSEFAAFDPHLVLLDVSLPSSTATTGVRRSAGSPRRHLISHLRLRTM